MAEHGNKVGGKSPKEEILVGAVIKGMTGYLNSVEDKAAVQQMLLNLPAISKLLLDPLARHTLLALMPDFGRPEIARALKDIIEAGGHAIEDMAHDAHKRAALTDEQLVSAFETGSKVANDIKYAVLGRCFHRAECGELPAPRAQGGGKKGEPRVVKNDYREISLAEAIRQRYIACQFCISGVKDVKAPAEKPVQRKLEPLEIIASCKDEAIKKAFVAWLKNLSSEDKSRVWAAFKHLSSEDEFIGTMTIVSALAPEEHTGFIDQLEPMLRSDEKRAETRDFLGSIGSVIQGGGELAMDLLGGVWNAKSVQNHPRSPAVPATATETQRRSFGLIKALTL